MIGDLEEDFERVVRQAGRRAARRRYRREAVSSAAAGTRRRASGAAEAWGRETRRAARSLRRSPAYTVTTVLTLSVALGGVCAIAAVAHSILRPLPFPESERLVAVWETHDGERRWVAPANYLDWRRAASTFEEIAAHDTRDASVTVDGSATRERVAVVSGNFFHALGLAPTLGRGFDPDLDTGFPEHVAILSRRAWSSAFGSDPGVLGRDLLVADTPYRVVGVMPSGVDFPDPDLFAWLRSTTEAPGISGFDGDLASMRDAWYFQVVGRLAPGVTVSTASQEMDAVAARLAELHPDTNRDAGVRLVPLLEQTVSGSGPTLAGLAVAIAIVLLAACSNVVHLGLARSESRAAEVAVMRSLGARASDVTRRRVVEALLVSAAGGVGGTALAALVIARGGPLLATLPRPDEIALRPEVVTLTMGLSLLVALGVAVVTGRLAARDEAAPATGAGGVLRPASVRARLTGSRSAGSAIVAVQVAGAIALLSATALMARSLLALSAVDLGFEPDGLVTFRIALPDAPARSYAERVARYREVAGAVAALPGVASVGIGSDTPLEVGAQAGVFVVGEPKPYDPPDAGWQPVDDGWFDVMGMRLVTGRAFTGADAADAPDVAIVNETFARAVLGGRPALGARVTMGLDGHDRPLTIVGVVADTRARGPAAEPFPVLYRPVDQSRRFSASSMLIAVRLAGNAGPAPEAIRSTVRVTVPGMPLYAEALGPDLARPFRQTQATLALLLGAFAVTAIALALVGVYGVTAHSVGRRRREIGVRLALGARAGGVTFRLVAGRLRSAALGVPAGVCTTLLLGRILRRILYGVGPADPATLMAASALVLVTVAAAAYLPARAAARTDPAETTRAG